MSLADDLLRCGGGNGGGLIFSSVGGILVSSLQQMYPRCHCASGACLRDPPPPSRRR